MVDCHSQRAWARPERNRDGGERTLIVDAIKRRSCIKALAGIGMPRGTVYMMHQVNGRWLIYDIQIDDVSIVLNYRSQFANVLNKSSYADLIQLIRSKLQ